MAFWIIWRESTNESYWISVWSFCGSERISWMSHTRFLYAFRTSGSEFINESYWISVWPLNIHILHYKLRQSYGISVFWGLWYTPAYTHGCETWRFSASMELASVSHCQRCVCRHTSKNKLLPISESEIVAWTCWFPCMLSTTLAARCHRRCHEPLLAICCGMCV